MSNLQRIAEGIDPGPALEALAVRPELWDTVTVRQTYEGSAHKDTKTIFLRAPKTFENVLDCIDSVATPFVELVGQPVGQLVEDVVRLVGARELGRVMLVKLKPDGWIRPHKDEGAYARYYARFHFVLSGACTFYSGEDVVNMAPGELWWFNHQREHEVLNGDKDRIHLIFDALAPGFTGALHANT